MQKTLQLLTALFILSSNITAEENTFQAAQKMKSINNGQRLFRKKLQRKCGYTAAYWAAQHTTQEWKTLDTDEKFKAEFVKMCPRGEKVLKEKWIHSLELFAVEYAKDTGNRPRC